MAFIKAEPGMKRSVIYTDETGQYFRYSGGSLAWRNNNPGNLRPGEISKKHGQIGVVFKFAVFPDYESGHLALLDVLKICTSRLGDSYLKAPHSSFQVNLKNLIEKKPRT